MLPHERNAMSGSRERLVSVMFVDPPPAPGVLNAGLSNDTIVHPGFGSVALCRDGVEVMRDATGEKTLSAYEKRIRAHTHPHEPTAVWTLHIDAPFESLIYARTKDGWTLIERKDGFA